MMLILNYLFYFSEPHQKVPPFKLKIQTPTKRGFDSFLQEKSCRVLFEFGGDDTSKSFVDTSMKQLEEKSMPGAENKKLCRPRVEFGLRGGRWSITPNIRKVRG